MIEVVELVRRLETIDHHILVENREPLAIEANTYRDMLEELSRRGQSKILPYYVKRWTEVYKKYA
jgi:hypothetical protein